VLFGRVSYWGENLFEDSKRMESSLNQFKVDSQGVHGSKQEALLAV
jgi:hypothetical protein